MVSRRSVTSYNSAEGPGSLLEKQNPRPVQRSLRGGGLDPKVGKPSAVYVGEEYHLPEHPFHPQEVRQGIREQASGRESLQEQHYEELQIITMFTLTLMNMSITLFHQSVEGPELYPLAQTESMDAGKSLEKNKWRSDAHPCVRSSFMLQVQKVPTTNSVKELG